MTFEEWDAANRDRLWNGGRTTLREQYREVWLAAITQAQSTIRDKADGTIKGERLSGLFVAHDALDRLLVTR